GYGALKPGIMIPNRDKSPMHAPPRPALPLDRVRFVGEALAFVVAETAALAADAPQIHADVPGNIGLDYHYGDSAAVAAAIAGAAHVTRLSLRSNRIVVNAMEPRAALAHYDAERQHWTLHIGCQGVFGLRNTLAGL